MEKIKIAKEQADAIEKAWKMTGNKVFIIRMHDRDGSVLIDGREQLGDISTDTLIRALYIGYEVEPEVGDWVKFSYTDGKYDIGKVLELKEGYVIVDFANFEVPQHIMSTDLSNPTLSEIVEEKERRFWGKYGRKIFELKKGDTVISNTGCLFFVEDSNGVSAKLKDTSLRVKTSEINIESYFKKGMKVHCFKESRLDVSKEDE